MYKQNNQPQLVFSGFHPSPVLNSFSSHHHRLHLLRFKGALFRPCLVEMLEVGVDKFDKLYKHTATNTKPLWGRRSPEIVPFWKKTMTEWCTNDPGSLQKTAKIAKKKKICRNMPQQQQKHIDGAVLPLEPLLPLNLSSPTNFPKGWWHRSFCTKFAYRLTQPAWPYMLLSNGL